LVYFTAIWYIYGRLVYLFYGHFVYFVGIWYIFAILVCMFYEEESGNPVLY
jgi:hypothetical protein